MLCPFCGGPAPYVFHRAERTYGRCSICGAFLRTDRRTIQSDVYRDGEFARRIESSIGTEPDFAKFDEIAPRLRPGSILEIGCGTGHMLAAAKARGRIVAGTELSPHHREYVKRQWGIEATESLPAGSFDNVVSCNVFEHIADPYEHLLAVRRILNPGGRFLISTANANCLIAKLCGPWWAMFKPEDHFSIPSAASLRIVGERAQFRVGPIWCSEYPLETPVGLALALRDRMHRGNGASSSGDSGAPRPVTGNRVQRIRELHAFGFVGAVLARMMIAGSIKAILELP